MSFCPKCNNSYDIKKSINIDQLQTGGKLDDEEIVKQIVEKNVIDTSILKSINLDELMKKDFYIKLLNKDKEYVYNVIYHQQVINDDESKKSTLDKRNTYFHCIKCGNQEYIKPKTLIFSNIINDSIFDNTLDDTNYMIYDNTLPRTKYYTCENKECETHKNPEKKEAVFYRYNNSYQLVYLCTICKTKWEII